MSFWLLKSEPEAFSIDDLARVKVSPWDGVRNYAARNNLRAMKKGDRAFFYHSSVVPSAIVGEIAIVKEAYPDPTQFDPKNAHYDADSSPGAPRWSLVDVKFVRKFAHPLTLPEIKKQPGLKNMALLKYGRLSVQPVTAAEWALVSKLCAKDGA